MNKKLHAQHKTGSAGLGWKLRGAFILTGVLIISMGRIWLSRGPWPGKNWFGQTVFPEGLIVFGFVICCLALLPPGDWTYRHITTKRRKKFRK